MKKQLSNTQKTKSELILNAALGQFAENGFHSSPVSQLAVLAGVGVGTIYRYFKDKDELIHAVFEKIDENLQKELAESLDTSLSGRSQYIQFISILIRYMNAHTKEFIFMEQYYSSPYGIETKHERFLRSDGGDQSDPIANLFADTKKAVLKNLPLPILLAMTFGPVIFLVRDSRSGLVTLDDAVIRQTAEACWDAIKA